jgi:hypothetical protein
MLFGNKLKKKADSMGAEDAIFASYFDGLGLPSNVYSELFLFHDRLLIAVGNMQPYELKLSQVRAAVNRSEQEIVEKGKSVVGRALIGTLLVPGLGTIVGGMSGIGTKQKKGKENNYLIINYIDAQGDLKGITFINNLNIIAVHKFCEKINATISINNDGAPIQL